MARVSLIEPANPYKTLAAAINAIDVGGGALTAADIANVPSGGLAATDVQDALNELEAEIVAVSATAGVSSFNTRTGAITLNNADVIAALTAGTTAQYFRGDKTWQALDKAAVGLGNVDNTADAAKNVLSATKLTPGRNINGVLFDGTANITITASDPGYTAADVLAKLLTVDGAGSGLDADLLDGQSSAFYLARVNHTGTQLAATISDLPAAVGLLNAATATALATSRNFSIAGGGITAPAVGFNGTAPVVLSASVDAAHITLARMANLAANSFIGNNTGAPATPIALTAAQAKALLAIASTDVSGLGTMAVQNANAVAITGGTAALSALAVSGLILSTAPAGAPNMEANQSTGIIANDGTYDFPAMNYAFVFMSEMTATGQFVLFATDGVVVRIIFQSGALFTTAIGTAGKVNLYYNTTTPRIQNKTGGNTSFRTMVLKIN